MYKEEKFGVFSCPIPRNPGLCLFCGVEGRKITHHLRKYQGARVNLSEVTSLLQVQSGCLKYLAQGYFLSSQLLSSQPPLCTSGFSDERGTRKGQEFILYMFFNLFVCWGTLYYSGHCTTVDSLKEGISSFHGYLGWNSGYQAWGQESQPAEASRPSEMVFQQFS